MIDNSFIHRPCSHSESLTLNESTLWYHESPNVGHCAYEYIALFEGVIVRYASGLNRERISCS